MRQAARALLVVAAAAVSVLAVLATPVRAASPGGAPPGGWEWPLAGPRPVVRTFAPPAERYGRGHRGVDLAGAPGDVVVAAGAGRVSYAGLLAGRGVVVVVHGELRSTYEPVTADVALGQQVSAGQPLGRLAVGHEGCAATACLHWGLRRGEQYLDPLVLVGAGPVRLLPVLDEPRAGAAARALPASSARAPGDSGPAVAAVAAEQSPALDLRAAASPSGVLAVAALVAGLVLLTRPRPRPRTPSAAAAGPPFRPAAPGPPPTPALTAGDEEAELVDLGAERHRRRAAG